VLHRPVEPTRLIKTWHLQNYTLRNSFGKYGRPLASQRDNLTGMNSRPRRCSKSILLTILGLCVLWSGCRSSLDDLTVWKTEVRSPDGLWIASAVTIQNGGFGSANIGTVVSLQQADVPRPPIEVLEFNCEGPVPHPYTLDNVANAGGTINLTMKWLTPSRLDVTYNGRKGNLDFQAVKAFGTIEISVQDLSREPTKSNDSK
jgi:hypothetical protein